jgi:hypothetical protein
MSFHQVGTWRFPKVKRENAYNGTWRGLFVYGCEEGTGTGLAGSALVFVPAELVSL